jgi:hypothetical protein
MRRSLKARDAQRPGDDDEGRGDRTEGPGHPHGSRRGDQGEKRSEHDRLQVAGRVRAEMSAQSRCLVGG